MLEIKNLSKIYKPRKPVPVKALSGITLSFPKTGMVFLLGKSGSGKSTLLNLLGNGSPFQRCISYFLLRKLCDCYAQFHFGVSILVAAMASFFPVKKIASKKPVDAIRGR